MPHKGEVKLDELSLSDQVETFNSMLCELSDHLLLMADEPQDKAESIESEDLRFKHYIGE